jgi:hypothetical protein
MALKKHLPTVTAYLEKRKKAAMNRLPKHLRAPTLWPLAVQVALNLAILITLTTLVLNKDDYLSDAGPAITMIICLLLVIFCIVEGIQFRRRYHQIRGERWARLNFILAILSFLAWAATVAIYIP